MQACRDESRRSNRTGVLVNLIPYNPGPPPLPTAAPTSAAETHSSAGDMDAAAADTRAALAAGRLPHHSSFRKPSMETVSSFQAALRELGVWASVRAARGDDQASACGQLSTSRAHATHGRDGGRADGAGGGAHGGSCSDGSARSHVSGSRAKGAVRGRHRVRSADIRMSAEAATSDSVERRAKKVDDAMPMGGATIATLDAAVDATLSGALAAAGAARQLHCCMSCQGVGTVPVRRSRKRRKTAAATHGATTEGTLASKAAAAEATAPPSPTPPSPSPPSTVQCSRCGGIGLVPRPAPRASAQATRGADCDVAIVGGGIGGLALALALQQRGMHAVVYERDESFGQRAQGYGLTLQQAQTLIHAISGILLLKVAGRFCKLAADVPHAAANVWQGASAIRALGLSAAVAAAGPAL